MSNFNMCCHEGSVEIHMRNSVTLLVTSMAYKNWKESWSKVRQLTLATGQKQLNTPMVCAIYVYYLIIANC